MSANLLAKLTAGGGFKTEVPSRGIPDITREEIMGGLAGRNARGRRLMHPAYLLISGIYLDDEKHRDELKAFIDQHFYAEMLRSGWALPEYMENRRRLFANLVGTLCWFQHWGGYRCPVCNGIDLQDAHGKPITCPECGTKGVLEEDDEEGDGEGEEEAGAVECVECGGDVPVTSSKRPLLITCPGCGTKGVVEE